MTLPFRPALAASAALLALALPAVSAQAHPLHAAPDSGDVSIYEPFYAWTGQAPGSAIQLAHFAYGAQLVDECDPAFCDEFALKVGPGAENIEVGVEYDGGYVEVQIRDEAGKEVFYSTGEADEPTVWKAANPAGGTYLVEVLTPALGPDPVDDPTYSAYAKLNDGVATPLPDGDADGDSPK